MTALKKPAGVATEAYLAIPSLKALRVVEPDCPRVTAHEASSIRPHGPAGAALPKLRERVPGAGLT